jgi:hypothetical protein
VRRLIDAFNEGGVSEASVGFFDADAVFEEPLDQPGSEEAHGQDAVGRSIAKREDCPSAFTKLDPIAASKVLDAQHQHPLVVGSALRPV